MAGAGIPGGQAYGKSDKTASAPVEKPVSPEDVIATVYHLLGLEPHSYYLDQLNRPVRLAEGEVLKEFMGA